MNEQLSQTWIKLNLIISNKWTIRFLILILGILLGSMLFSTETESVVADHTEHSQKTIWTCSMHPQVKLDEPGQCPICFMDLIPLKASGMSAGAEKISLSKSAAKLSEISTSTVRRGRAITEIRLSGKISYDETRVKSISAWFPGRLDRLFVDYTGIKVNRGDHLFEIYSPELYSAQEELLLAYRRTQGQAAQQNGSTGEAAFQSVKAKTKLLGLSEAQINAILRNGSAQSALQINSPITGIVTHKNAVEGKYVRTGEPIYTIADLSKVWLILDAYERDLPWLAYGQKLSFSVAGLPGRTYSANISYIDPLVDPMTRSVTVRAVLDNPQGLLKPGMLAEATISVSLNGEGYVITPDLSGKWTCPMHPEVMESHPGDCPVCGMNLVKITKKDMKSPIASDALLIPGTAVLKTGKRALVYVEQESEDLLTYEMREVVLGPRVGDDYIILSGLAEGERVVTKGNFKIDSAMQIAGKTSMMSAAKSKALVAISAEFQTHLSLIYQDYLLLQSKLAGDDLKASGEALNKLLSRINSEDIAGERMPQPWVKLKRTLDNTVAVDKANMTLESIRKSFDPLSQFVLGLQTTFGHFNDTTLYEIFCPMAFDNQGASWLQTDKQVKNPYFGARMLDCGEVRQSYASVRLSHE
ncbi:MAG: efflux RND transporter periplasmic adaptor subunit [Candidatus Marinimicrobia bacterium]|nr:efflux RND transporter periplasmic adaptor subunit [Candidatus Neomarinimicrobiota bacterium]MCF7921218.1 efflux RND transporter periplasmic adaptor subunit [Candidatus Neomarinimicrobiota bacterium]